MKNKYQDNYSTLYSHKINYDAMRKTKALKTYYIIKDYFKKDMRNMSVLEVGCYKGDSSIALSPYFGLYCAFDIDQKAISSAFIKAKSFNLLFFVGNAEYLFFPDEMFDIVVCSHIYEHVPNPQKMMDEIYRVLKGDGICYFAGGNKLKLMEPHYNLPFLSWAPKKIGHAYLKIFNKGEYYYENLKTFPQLKNLVNKFERQDYSIKILNYPEKFEATEMLKSNSLKRIFGIFIYKYFRLFFPTFIWILVKNR